MKKSALLLICFIVCVNSVPLQASERKIVSEPLHSPRISLFPLTDIRLFGSDFKRIQDLDHAYLLSLEPDRLLSWFRREAGLSAKAPAYPFWESEDVWGAGPLAGHSLGFYMSSMAMMYESTGDTEIKKKLEYTLEELKECQDAQGDGYLLATINGRHVFQDVVNNNFTTRNAVINGVWEPVYIMNKIMLGLYNVYLACGMPLAKEVLLKMADWFGYEILDKLDHSQIQKLLVCEHGSVNESYIDVYSVSGDKKYLDWAGKLNDEDMWVPASQKRDVLNGWHANTQIPKFTGFERVYTYTGEKKYAEAARFFWETVLDKHTWVIGGNSTGEHFFPMREFEKRITNRGGPESCNSVNMMRLTEALYQNDGEMRKVDYYERVLYNHILANYDPHEGMCTYFTSMRPGHYRMYGTKYDSFWCCTGTGMEAPAKFGRMIYAHTESALLVNLFIPSSVDWRDKGVRLSQHTRFPDENTVEITVESKQDVRFSLHIRHPYWVKSKKISLSLNGAPLSVKMNKGGYAEIERMWKNGDKVHLKLEPSLYTEPLKGSTDYVAVLYGPLVLANPVDNTGLTDSEFRIARKTVATEEIAELKAPAVFTPVDELPRSIYKKPGEKLSFECAGRNVSATFELRPFNRIHFNRYAIYFPVYKDKKEYEAAYEEVKETILEKDLLEENTIDRVLLKSSESEKAHKLDGVNMGTGQTHGNSWRHATEGGYFMYEMAVLPGQSQSVYLRFIRTDSGSRVFDVLVDGQVIGTVDHCLPKDLPELFYDERIRIPDQLIGPKKSVTVKLQAKKGNTAGGLFDLRIVKSH